MRADSARAADDHYRRLQQREVLNGLALSEKTLRYSIAGYVIVFGAVGALTLLSPQGPRGQAGHLVAIAFLVSTIPVGVAMGRTHLGSVWWSNRTRVRHGAELFVAYADIGLTATLLTFRNAEAALFGAVLFAVIGAYVAHFLPPYARNTHVVFTSVVIAVLGLICAASPAADVISTLARVLTAGLVANGTVALHGAYTTAVRHAIASSYSNATTDPLTGVANRRAFEHRSRYLIETARYGVLVLVIDINDFKLINDTFGHAKGDEILVDVATTLRSWLGEAAVVGRLGGDEFAATVAAPHEQLASPDIDYVDDLTAQISTSVSIGSARSHQPSVDSTAELSTLLGAADRELYIAKAAKTRAAQPPFGPIAVPTRQPRRRRLHRQSKRIIKRLRRRRR